MCSVAVALAGNGYSEEKKSENAPAIMDEVVVTATKTPEKRKEIANSVVLMDADAIKESPAQSVGQLLANEPGIDLRTYGNYGAATEEIHIRGMGGDATQVVVNGVVINSPSLGVADVGQIPLNNIEKIEIVKGPGSLLYGSGAMGGTVNIITKRPKPDKVALTTEVGYGTQDTYRLAAENGMVIGGGLGYYLTANRKETDGFRSNSDLKHTDASLNLLLNKGDKLDLSLYGDLVDRKYGVPGPKPPAGTQDYFINGLKFYDSESASLVNRGSDENYRTALELKSRLTDWLRLRMKADHSVQKSYNLDRGYNTVTWMFDGSETESWVTNTIHGVEGNVDLTPCAWTSLLVGSEYRDFNYKNKQQNLDNTGAQLAGGVSTKEHQLFTQGTFAELSLKPIEQLKVNAGYRYEEHSTFGHANVTRLGLVVNPLDGTTLKANHGKHFKAPTMNQLFWPDDGSAKGNQSLKPETGWHTDFTVEQSLLNNHIFATVSYFRWDIKDKIDWAEDPSQPTAIPGLNYYTPTNLYTYKATGWELNAKIGPYYSLLLDTSLTLLDAEEEMAPGAARPARYKPECQFKGDLKYFTDFGLASTITARYVGSRPGYYQTITDLTPKIELDSYWTMDLKIEQVIAEHFRVALIATNIFDKGYATYVANFKDQNSWKTTQEQYPGAGRSMFLQVGYEF